MFLINRKALAGIGCTAAAVASTALFAMPAQAASAGQARVIGSSTVQFNALVGKSNALTITISGRTVTLDDKVAIKAGKGCKAVKRDKTKVKCTTSKTTARINVSLSDKNDSVNNKTRVFMLADGGAGNDTLIGGLRNNQLQGGPGNDRLNGKAGVDTIFGGAGNDYIAASGGNDHIEAGAGADKVYGEAGNDAIFGDAGVDRLAGGVGDDVIYGDADADAIYGEAGDDEIYGGAGNDQIIGAVGIDYISGDAGNDVLVGDAGDDFLSGEAGNDVLNGGAGDDGLIGKAGNDRIAGGVGDDALVGENVGPGAVQFGSDAALDRLDGGANTPAGDLCLVMAAGTTVNCEDPDQATTSAARVSTVLESMESAKAALQTHSRVAAARAAE